MNSSRLAFLCYSAFLIHHFPLFLPPRRTITAHEQHDGYAMRQSLIPFLNDRPGSSETAAWLTFGVAWETYGIEMWRVREVANARRLSAAGSSHNSPAGLPMHAAPAIAGYFRKPGLMVPVLDIRMLLGLESQAGAEQRPDSRVLLCEIAPLHPTAEDDDVSPSIELHESGLLVDWVGPIRSVHESKVAPPDNTRISPFFIHGIYRSGLDHVTLLQFERLLRGSAARENPFSRAIRAAG